MNIIACADAQWNIGKNGRLLFKLPEDMKRFRELTLNKVLIMGRKTLETLPGGMPLPGRLANIILTSNPDFSIPTGTVVHTLEELFALLKNYNSHDIYVIGGGDVYAKLAPYCNRAHITRVNAVDSDADTSMPDMDGLKGWSIEKSSEPRYHDGLEFEFVDYVNGAVTPLPA